jgi:predicted RNA-binding protein with PUA-like domain
LKDWLAKLKVGDEVFVTRSYGQCPEVVVVSRITKAMIMTKYPQGNQYESRFRRDSGRSVGAGTWNSEYLIESNEDHHRVVRIAKLKELIRNLRASLVVPVDEAGMSLLAADLRKYQPPVAK